METCGGGENGKHLLVSTGGVCGVMTEKAHCELLVAVECVLYRMQLRGETKLCMTLKEHLQPIYTSQAQIYVITAPQTYDISYFLTIKIKLKQA